MAIYKLFFRRFFRYGEFMCDHFFNFSFPGKLIAASALAGVISRNCREKLYQEILLESFLTKTIGQIIMLFL